MKIYPLLWLVSLNSSYKFTIPDKFVEFQNILVMFNIYCSVGIMIQYYIERMGCVLLYNVGKIMDQRW
jgi:hypothetical protein